MIKVLGYEFKPMTETDRMGFAGAPTDTVIAETPDERVLLYSPSEETVSELWIDVEGVSHQRDWKCEVIL